jgi:hypothetical protein
VSLKVPRGAGLKAMRAAVSTMMARPVPPPEPAPPEPAAPEPTPPEPTPPEPAPSPSPSPEGGEPHSPASD